MVAGDGAALSKAQFYSTLRLISLAQVTAYSHMQKVVIQASRDFCKVMLVVSSHEHAQQSKPERHNSNQHSQQ